MISLVKRFALLGVCAVAIVALTTTIAIAAGGQSGAGGEPPGANCEGQLGQPVIVSPPFRGEGTAQNNFDGTWTAIGTMDLVGSSPGCSFEFTLTDRLPAGLNFNQIRPAHINGLCSTENNVFANLEACPAKIQACGSAGVFQVLGASGPKYNAAQDTFTTDLVVTCIQFQ